MMANCNNVMHGILIVSAWCILVCCSRLQTGGDISNAGSSDMYFKFGVSRQSNVAQNINSQGSGDTFVMYGDCGPSSVTTNVYSYGSGDTYLMYGYSCGSNTCVPSNANMGEEWARNMNNQGSGDLYIKYGSCNSSSDSTLGQNVYLRGSGDVKILYENYSASKVGHKIFSAGSGNVFIMYANCGSNEQRSANNDEKSAHNIHTQGSGRVYISYGNRGGTASSMGRNSGIGTIVNCEPR